MLPIQGAIYAAHSGDTILVAPGTYYVNLVVGNTTVTLRSMNGPAQTILDGGSKDQVLKAGNSGSNVLTVDAFTIQHGAEPGTTPALGGVYVSGNTVLTNNIIQNNYGYPVYLYHGYATILNNSISSISPTCSIYDQPGLIVETDSTNMPSTVSGNTITGDGTTCSGSGISIYAVSAPVTVENNLVTGTALGIDADDASAPPAGVILLIRQNLLVANLGGGILLDVLFSPATPGQGPVTTVVTQNTLRNNLICGRPPANFITPPAELTLVAYYGRIGVYNNIFDATSTKAPVVACFDVASFPNLTPPWFDSNDFYNQQLSSGVPLFSSNCGCSGPSLLTLNGNVSVDPLFVSPTNSHLTPSSPLRDTGNNSAYGMPGVDYAGTPRLLDTGSTYPVVDPGIYELPGTEDSTVSALIFVASSYSQPNTQPLTLTAGLAVPAGAVPGAVISFLEDDLMLGSAVTDSSGSASLTFQTASAAVHRYTSQFIGSTRLSPARSTVLYVSLQGSSSAPSATSTNLTCSPSMVNVGDSSLLSAIVSTAGAQPAGMVTFTDKGSVLAQQSLVNGAASLGYTAQAPGPHTMMATYHPTSAFVASSGACTLQVNPRASTLALMSSSNPITAGLPVTFTALVPGSSGSVQIRGSAMVAEVHRLFDDPSQTERLRQILSEHLFEQ
ncbi:MAG: Ig-like domain repeat protein [Janthinobacterium lividum]